MSCLLLQVCIVSAQSITQFFPASATPGTIITIIGTGLSSVTSVKFCGFPDSALININGSDDTIYARVGTNCEGQGPGYITLVSPGGNAT
ncbi:MAG TPA: IPT/TIG domain-containing protein, partial [Puia sp.]